MHKHFLRSSETFLYHLKIKDIRRRDDGRILINIFPLNSFRKMLLSERYFGGTTGIIKRVKSTV